MKIIRQIVPPPADQDLGALRGALLMDEGNGTQPIQAGGIL